MREIYWMPILFAMQTPAQWRKTAKEYIAMAHRCDSADERKRLIRLAQRCIEMASQIDALETVSGPAH